MENFAEGNENSIEEPVTERHQRLSFAAGSRSRDPHGYRIAEDFSLERFDQLKRTLPAFQELADNHPIIINAYPAELGLANLGTYVDTYLHAITFVRACRLAALQHRPVVFIAQPVLGVEFLLFLLEEGYEMPEQIAWISGGYYFPQSLESFARTVMKEAGSSLSVIHSYGVAEIGHTCFVALRRFDDGQPMYQLVADNIDVILNESGELSLGKGEVLIATGETAKFTDGYWKISNSPIRLCDYVKTTLEGLTSAQWLRLTGRTNWRENELVFQLRRSQKVDQKRKGGEHSYFEFWDHFGGGPTYKPCWGDCSPNQAAREPEFASRLRLSMT